MILIGSEKIESGYLAGPMRVIELYNFPEFNRIAQQLRELHNVEVFNPAERDLEDDGFNPAKDKARGLDYYMQFDIPAVCQRDCVFVLKDWEKSQGARLEVHVAREIGKPVLDAYTLQIIDKEPEEIMTESTTGGKKGTKLCRVDLLPVKAMWELAEHYGKGSQKYDDNNYRKGYEWSKSYAAGMRHALQFWGGEDIDPETGSKHVIATAWHFLALAIFMDEHPDFDDRYNKKETA